MAPQTSSQAVSHWKRTLTQDFESRQMMIDGQLPPKIMDKDFNLINFLFQFAQ